MIIEALMVASLALSPAEGKSVPVQPTDRVVVERGPKVWDGDSLYRGRWFKKDHESHRRCIRDRESNDHYGAVNGTGTYRGAYQMSPALGVGAGWMIQKDLKREGVSHRQAKRIGERLRSTPVNQWAPYWQDYAFWIVWDKGEGRSHWGTFGQTHACF